MIREELYKVFRSKKAWAVVIIGLIMGILHTKESIFFTGSPDVKMNPYHPVFASFLNGVSAEGSYRTYFTWAMPIFLIVAYCGRYSDEKKKNMDIAYFTRVGKRKMFFGKLKTSALVAIIINAVPNIYSIIVTTIFMHGQNGFTDMESWSEKSAGRFVYWTVHNPYKAYILYLLSNFIIACMLAVICQCAVFIFEDSRLAMLIVFAIWLGVNFGNRYIYLGRALQIYAGDLKDILWGYAGIVPMVLLWFAAGYIKVVKKSDKI